ncbi:hypothetical protein ANO11243_052900 [Dothideomycetidae sp. 11243]|nr:hypothetical protein ANO11243_052900 [fungal sp. No.11243]
MGDSPALSVMMRTNDRGGPTWINSRQTDSEEAVYVRLSSIRARSIVQQDVGITIGVVAVRDGTVEQSQTHLCQVQLTLVSKTNRAYIAWLDRVSTVRLDASSILVLVLANETSWAFAGLVAMTHPAKHVGGGTLMRVQPITTRPSLTMPREISAWGLPLVHATTASLSARSRSRQWRPGP